MARNVVKANDLSAQTVLMRNALAAFMGYSHGGARDMYEVFGWSRQPDVNELFAMYMRNGIANRVIRAFPQATWNTCPIIRDEAGSSANKDDKDYSPFCESVVDFFEDNGIYRYIERADRISSVGRYGVMVMGFKDGKDLSKPLTSRKAPLLYMSPYGERGVTVDRYDEDTQSPRYGMPLFYRLNGSNELSVPGGSGSFPRRSGQRVHYSRVLHISEFLEQDEVYGMPRLLPILNHLKDLEKVTGGNAEVYWLNANRGTLFSVDQEHTVDDDAISDLKKQADEFQHQLRRYLVGHGVDAKVLGSDPADNDKSVDKLLDLIAGGAGVPKRILTGSEAGELASSQDESNWSSRIAERRTNYAGPSILRPLVQMYINTGNIIPPKGKWWVEWPDAELGAVADTDLKAKKLGMVTSYAASAGADVILPITQFYRDFLNMTPPEGLSDTALADAALEADVPEDPNPKTNMRARTAYVSRKVVNAKDIIKWAKSQGFTDIADDLHVTVAYIETPFDWARAGETFEEEMTFAAGGPRSVELFGEGVAVIEFPSSSLNWRNSSIKSVSTGYDYNGGDAQAYKPHITFSKKFDIETFRNAQPYTGRIVLGPEIWEEIQ